MNWGKYVNKHAFKSWKTLWYLIQFGVSFAMINKWELKCTVTDKRMCHAFLDCRTEGFPYLVSQYWGAFQSSIFLVKIIFYFFKYSFYKKEVFFNSVKSISMYSVFLFYLFFSLLSLFFFFSYFCFCFYLANTDWILVLKKKKEKKT